MTTATRFTPESTRKVLVAACRVASIESGGADLIRLGENALYRLADQPIIVRIGRSEVASTKEVAIARWLKSHRFPAATLADLDQPVMVDGTPVTFWNVIQESPVGVSSADLGYALRGLHAIPDDVGVGLPEFEPMPKVAERVAAYGSALSEADVKFLLSRKSELDARFRGVSFELPRGPVHGDAHEGNLMRDFSGLVHLIDFEDFCIGPREWDVCVEAVRYKSFRWIDGADYRTYVNAYGWDPLGWSGFPVVQAARELNMTTWLLQLSGHSDAVDQEIRRRIDDLARGGSGPRQWQTF